MSTAVLHLAQRYKTNYSGTRPQGRETSQGRNRMGGRASAAPKVVFCPLSVSATGSLYIETTIYVAQSTS